MEIFHRPATAKGPAATFTGDVWVDGIYADAAPDRARPAIVRFAPDARSHRHAHRLGRTLHIVEGIALLGSRDGTVVEAHPGDTGDAPQTDWAEPVSDGTYRAPRTPTR